MQDSDGDDLRKRYNDDSFIKSDAERITKSIESLKQKKLRFDSSDLERKSRYCPYLKILKQYVEEHPDIQNEADPGQVPEGDLIVLDNV